MKKVAIASVSVIAMLWLLILATDTKILMKEVKVDPGQDYVVEGYGNLGDSKQSSLVGYYFNGRKIVKRVYWYSSNNIMGRDSCPFILRD